MAKRKKVTVKPDSNSRRKLTAKQLRIEITRLMQSNPGKRFSPGQVIRMLSLENNRDSVRYAMEKLLEEGLALPIDSENYRLNPNPEIAVHNKKSRSNPLPVPKENARVLEGTVDVTRSGSAYIVIPGKEEDVFVAAKNLNGAMHGDTVQIEWWTPRGRRRPEGEVLKVVKRAIEQFVGTLHLQRKMAVVTPDRMHTPFDIYIRPADTGEARDGDKVVVKITDWPKKPGQSPYGVVTMVLGAEGSSDLEMKAILINNGFDLEFADATLEEAEKLPAEITEAEIARRRDIREVPTFTIDPYNAKDFDDALSIRRLEDGDWEIGVHIADVAHYVHPNTALDQEAYKRSTSVYLVDRVLPMLPERLSNDLCSLRPHEDKLTFSAIFRMDEKAKVKERWFGRTVIHSDRRFTYEEAQEILDQGEGDFDGELRELNKLAHLLRKARFKNGSIDFDLEEVQFRLDEEGVPVEVFVKERKEAHMLIEDFMLLANREVAAYIGQRENEAEIPFVYRVHDLPNQDKVAELARFAWELGFRMNIQTPQQIAASFNALAKAAEENERLHILEPIAVRTMAKAEYSTENIGHYGLAFDYYSHFTSPIRRYSDVLAHRILFENLEDRRLRVDKSQLALQCKHISAQERRAMEAERESIKYKQVEFIKKHLGEQFEGFISGIIDRGFFVELKANKCEGFVPFDSMNDRFEVEEGRLEFTGRRTGLNLKMGDPVQVRIVSADLARRQIEMVLVDGEE